MNFEVELQDGYIVIQSKVDKLDASNASELKSIVLKENKNNVNNMIIYLLDTSYCDSSGLSAILTANRVCKSSGGQMILAGLQPNVQKMIEIAQLHRVLPIEQNLPDAIALMKDTQED
jgi:anti-sigma B factor antagonist